MAKDANGFVQGQCNVLVDGVPVKKVLAANPDRGLVWQHTGYIAQKNKIRCRLLIGPVTTAPIGG